MGKRRIDAHRRRRGEEPLVRAQFWIRTTQGKEIKKEKNGEKKRVREDGAGKDRLLRVPCIRTRLRRK
jgi:hypothetical protein